MMTAPDKIFISDMDCLTVIGVTAQERTVPQHLFVDLEFPVDGKRAAATDSIDDAVDYDTVARAVAEVCASQEFHLIETVAEQIAVRVLEWFRLPQVRVLVRKISPVAAPRVKYVSVEIIRSVSS
jgi:dihydroneopterin aldolase